MFEVGAGYTVLPAGEVPDFSPQRLEKHLAARVLRRSLTVWQEHCSECAMPSCYSSCAFYRPRLDYKCRRLDNGVRVVPSSGHISVPIMVRFGRWARLLGYGPAGLHDVNRARRRESRALMLSRAAERIPASRGLAAPVRRRLTNISSRPRAWGTSDLTRLFVVIETVNPAPDPVGIVFSFGALPDRQLSGSESFKTTLTLGSGYAVHTIPVADLVRPEMLDQRFFMQVAPAGADEHPELVFGLLDVAELSTVPAVAAREGAVSPAAAVAPPEPKLKCIVWDLDNTIWSGILVEDGLDGLKLKPEAVAAIRALDAKGVLQSIASKNDPDDALAALRKFSLEEFFLFPQIAWEPKSEGIRRISEKLNIGIDTFAFVDDQVFERAEVAAALPQVMMVDPTNLPDFLGHSRLDIPITAEASQRRSLYRAEGRREQAKTGFGGSYEEFLTSCRMTATIEPFGVASLDRVFELVQRTNQLNISTCRYSRDELASLFAPGSDRKAFVVHAADRFGTYGLIGFVVFEIERSLILDLMFSCRVQSKLVDDGFISWLYEANLGREHRLLRARFRANKKNAPARQLLERLGFRNEAVDGDFEIWVKTSPGRPLADIRRIISVAVSDALGADSGG
jgi:FkbH-like protein